MRRTTVVAKAYNATCIKRRAKVNSDLYNLLCSYRNVDDLIDLDLSKNYVGAEAGFECIIELIKTAPQLRSINLSCTGLTTQNVVELVALLLNHPNVRDLTLNFNRLYIDSGVQLVRLARFNPRMMHIYIVDQPANDVERQLANHIPPGIVAEMQRHLRYNKQAAEKKALAGGGGAAVGGGTMKRDE